jgi:hypothetical protein
VADLTKFYGWGPREALDLTWSELEWWNEQAVRMVKTQQRQETAASKERRA